VRATESFEPMRARTLKESIVETLTESILSGKFTMGERLNESRLSRELRVSRAPIREALQQLHQSGLAVNLPRRGMFVVSLDDEDVQKINSLRLVLESEALRLCRARLLPPAEKKLTQLVERMERMKLTSAFQASSIDLEFHRLVWSLTKNEYLERTLTSLTAPLFAYAVLRKPKAEKMRMVLDSHHPLLEYVTGRSDESAEDVMLSHLRLGWSQPEAFASISVQTLRGNNARSEMGS
jgi:DNA-binding GntR family transcriptional regulator